MIIEMNLFQITKMWTRTFYSMMVGTLLQLFGREFLQLTQLSKDDITDSFDVQKLVTQPHRMLFFLANSRQIR
nr:protein ZC155.6 [imported] - Caenorhabditis elegans [Caenorhabditis elegans]